MPKRFVYKHLGVMYAAQQSTRDKGKHFMHQLIAIEPTAKILDMYASDMIHLIFRNVQEEFEVKRVRLAPQPDTIAAAPDPAPEPAPVAETPKGRGQQQDPVHGRGRRRRGRRRADPVPGPQRRGAQDPHHHGAGMKPVRPAPWLSTWLGLGLLFLAGFMAASCTTDSSGDSTQIDWNLSDSLKNYSNVVITLVDPDDTSKVLATVHSGKLENPASLASFKIPDSLGGDFKIQIRGYDDRGLLAFESRIDVADGKPQTPVKTPQDQLPAFLIKPVPAGLLSILDVSEGVLVPEFKSDVFAYAVEVSYDVTQLAVHASVSDSGSSMTLGGKPLASGDVSAPVELAVGKTDLTLAVKAADGSIKSYAIAVTRKAGNVALLTSLSVSAGILSPTFDPDSLEYAVTVPAEAETVTVSAVSADPLAKLASGGQPMDSALGKVVILAPGATARVQITVTSRDSSVTATYAVDLKRALSTDASLTSLLVTGSEIAPEFSPDSLTYAAITAQPQVAILPVARDKGAKIKVNGLAVVSGTLSPLINSPAAGATADITVAVTAADGAVKTYTVKLKRIALVGGLVNIALSTASGPVTLDSAFKIDRLAYKAAVARTSDKIKIQVTIFGPWFGLEQPSATINGSAASVTGTSSSNNINTIYLEGPLRLGLNLVKVGYGEGTYSFRVTREFSKEADLAQLAVSAGTLKPAFSAAVLSYVDTVPNSASLLKITASPKDSLAMVIVKLKRWVPLILKKAGSSTASQADTLPIFTLPYTTLAIDTLKPGVPSMALDLAVGANLVEVTVVAEDTTVRKTYSISVERRASANAYLSGLTVNTSSKVPLTLNPEFTGRTLSYTASTTAGFVTLTPTAGEIGQVIQVNGKPVATGAASASITLATGPNTIKVEVLAPDKVSKVTYTFTVTKIIIIMPPRGVEP